jgi:hypothetical protein
MKNKLRFPLFILIAGTLLLVFGCARVTNTVISTTTETVTRPVTSTRIIETTLSLDLPEQGDVIVNDKRFHYQKLTLTGSNYGPIHFREVIFIPNFSDASITRLPDILLTIEFPDGTKEGIGYPKLSAGTNIDIDLASHEKPKAGLMTIVQHTESLIGGSGSRTEWYILVSD